MKVLYYINSTYASSKGSKVQIDPDSYQDFKQLELFEQGEYEHFATKNFSS